MKPRGFRIRKRGFPGLLTSCLLGPPVLFNGTRAFNLSRASEICRYNLGTGGLLGASQPLAPTAFSFRL